MNERREFRFIFIFQFSTKIYHISFVFPSQIDSVALSVVHLSPLGSQLSFGQHAGTRIENVVDWDAIAKKYRLLFGGEPEETGSVHTESDNQSNASGEAQHGASTAPPVGNNTNAMNQV